MICPRCGRQNPDSQKFCVRCGCPLHPEEEEPSPYSGTTTSGYPSSSEDTDGWSDENTWSGWSESSSVEPLSHQEPAQPSSHEEVGSPLSHEAPAQPQAHEEPSEPQAHATPPTPQSPEKTSKRPPRGDRQPDRPSATDAKTERRKGQDKSRRHPVLTAILIFIAVDVVVSIAMACSAMQITSDLPEAIGDFFEDSDGSSSATDSTTSSSSSTTTAARQPDFEDTRQGALDMAQYYLQEGGFSRDSLKDWLGYDDFSQENIQYAVDNCYADWKEEALQKAQDLVDEESSGYSKEGLIDTLSGYGFADDEVSYAMDRVQADWNQEAVECATSYIDNVNLHGDELRGQLEYEGFTQDQIVYAMSKVK